MKDTLKDPARWRHFAIAGYGLIFMTFGIVGGWAAVAQIDRAVIATGFVDVESNRKTVSHFEGGIVKEILVKEGGHVEKGAVVLRLQQVQAQANDDLVRTQFKANLALEARLDAERAGKEVITWPSLLQNGDNDPVLAAILNDQTHQFEQRRASLNGQVEVLSARIDQLKTEIGGIAIEKESTQKQVSYIDEELVSLRKLAAKQLVPTSRVFAMEREKTRLEGVIGKLTSDGAKASQSIGEVQIQVQQLSQKFQEEVAASLLDVRQKIADLKQRVLVAEDVLKRVDIVAPTSGSIQNLKVFTLGQVVRPGEALLEIVPDDQPLVVNAQFATTDIDSVHAGMTAEMRFPAFHSRTIPVMFGELKTISNDRLLDEQSHQYYYLGVISLNRAKIPVEYRAKIRAGMPAEVIVSSGERTVLSYIVSPLSGSFRKAFREL